MEVQPISDNHLHFPPRSSSYRGLSIIDAYGGDPGIQFSPVVEDIPEKEPYPTLLNSVRRLREEDSPSGYYSFDIDETYGSNYGSDPDPEKLMTDTDEYDPFRQDLPVHTPRTPRSKIGTPVFKVDVLPPVPKVEVERTRADSVLTKDTIKRHEKTLPSRPNEGMVRRGETHPPPEKELPPPPQSQEMRDKAQDVRPARALKTESSPETPLKEPPPSIAKTAKERPAVEKPLPIPTLQARSRLTDEGTPFSSRTISRSTKPPSLLLKSSNGSTAAGSIISSSSSVLPQSTLTPGPRSSRSNHTRKSSQQQQHHKRTPSQLSRELLPTTTYTPHDRPLPLLPPEIAQQQSLIHPALRDTSPFAYNSAPLICAGSDNNRGIPDNEANMRRLRNLMIKRKPIRGEGAAAENDHGASSLPRVTSPASSNDLLSNKENRAMFSSPSLPTILNETNLDNRQSTTMISPAKPRPSIREIAQPVDSAQNMSQESVYKTASGDQSMGSSEAETVIVNVDDARSSSPPELLPPPIQTLEESPSKWGLRKKSPDKQAEPNRFSGGESSKITPYDLFTNATLRLQAHCAQERSYQQDPIVSENIVVENQAKWRDTDHISTLNLTRSRPTSTNAPKLSTVQLHCIIDHQSWHQCSNQVNPVDCNLCYQNPPSSFWSCMHCALRVCLACREKVEKAVANTKLSQNIAAIRDEAASRLLQYRAQKGELETDEYEGFRVQPSPVASVYYDYPAHLPEPPMSAVDFRSRSPGAMSMRSARSMGTMRPRGRAPPARGPIPNFGPPGGHRRFSDSRSHGPPLADFPPPMPRMPTAFRDEYDTGSPMRAPPRGRSRPRGPPPPKHHDPMVDINYGLGGDQGRMPLGIAGGGFPPPNRVRFGLPPEVARNLDTVDNTVRKSG
ncbi:hypothetical protein FKW77_001592 [Venturia effusa]|uniref:Uncharacterized protein n=1 Tax=Venturia effusa TaxID=50376 RepID=A0A517L8N7_9PEZI|nr:hypothetical protein FKW77_001592 [Venturia effusa]